MHSFRALMMANRSIPGVRTEVRRLRALLSFLNFRVFSYVKFFDESLKDDDPENFYLERQWCVVGNVNFERSIMCA